MLTSSNFPPKVIIVGGSLGGLCNAVALRGIGCEVQVFEKSTGLMKDRGAGIVLQRDVLELFDKYQVARPEEICVPVHSRRYLSKDGTVLQESPMSQSMTSWDMLYRKLREAVPDNCYHTGIQLLDFEQREESVIAHFNVGQEEICDLLVGADGPRSSVRQQVLPEIRSEYAGYVAWRGVVMEDQIPELADEFTDRFTFFQAPHTHILCYLIPGPNGSLLPRERRLNWVWYLNAVPGDELDQVLTDKDQRRRELSVPQGFVDHHSIELLYRKANCMLPPNFSRLIQYTEEPFIQTIHDLAVPRMSFGRVCLTGDAAFVPRPHTAASTAKAAANALTLADCLVATGGKVDDALRRWEPDQLQMGHRLKKYGQRLGNRSQFNN